jgi:DNA-binding GntR family transcriptional regulator
MREALAQLGDAATRQDVDVYLRLRWDFYSACYGASGRTRLVDQVERLYHRSERYNRIVLSTPQRFRQSLSRYTSFLAACRARDGLAAERVVQESLSWAVERVAATLPSEADA